jgi:hypothetical protein
MVEFDLQRMERRSRGPCNFLKGIQMFEIWDGDLFLFCVDHPDEAHTYSNQGFRVVELTSS